MTVTDTLARIDYVLMAESNAAGAEWLLDEFEAKWLLLTTYVTDAGVCIRPMIQLVDDHRSGCLCERRWPDWSLSPDAYHSCGDVVCTQCGRTVYELNARIVGRYGNDDFHTGHWLCLDCYPLSPPLVEEVS